MGSLSIWPQCETLPQNPVIMLEAFGRSKRVMSDITGKYKVWLISGDHKVELEGREWLEGAMDLEMVLLYPKEKLFENQTYHLQIDSLPEDERMPQLYARNGLPTRNPAWKITAGTDTQQPEWKMMPTTVEQHYTMYGCGPAVSTTIHPEFNDDNPCLAYVTLTNQKTKQSRSYYVAIYENTLSIGHGMCAGAFVYAEGATYDCEIQLMDASGNKSRVARKLSFKSPEPDDFDDR